MNQNLNSILKEKKEFDAIKKAQKDSLAVNISSAIGCATTNDEFQKMISNEVAEIVLCIKECIMNLHESTSDSECIISVWPTKIKHHKYGQIVVKEITFELVKLGYHASIYTASGGSDYDNDGIPHSTWMSQSINVDLKPIRDELYKKGLDL